MWVFFFSGFFSLFFLSFFLSSLFSSLFSSGFFLSLVVFSFAVSIIRHATGPSQQQHAPLASARLHSPENASREIGRKMAPTKRQAGRYGGGRILPFGTGVSRWVCVYAWLCGSTPACLLHVLFLPDARADIHARHVPLARSSLL